MSRTIFRGGRLVDPSQGLDAERDLAVADGVVAEVGVGLEADADDLVVDASGLVVAPGLIDLRARLGEPGLEHRETYASGLQAAAAGGFTAVAVLPDSDPILDGRAMTELAVGLGARHPYARVYPLGAISRAGAGEELAEIGDMAAAGIAGLAGEALANGTLLRRALEHAAHYDLTVLHRSEDVRLSDGGVMHEGRVSSALGLPAAPAVAEDAALARDLLIAAETGGRYHAAAVSTARGLAMVREAKRRGLAVSCSVTAHHLLLSDDLVAESGFSPAARTSPPLRPAADAEALRAGLADRTVDAIVSDHAPFHPDEKDVPFGVAPPGNPGLETVVAVCLDRLVADGTIPLERLIELLAGGPAGVLGRPGGSLATGCPADVTLLDLERETTVDPRSFFSRGRTSPFSGWQLRGAPVATWVGGRPIELPGR